jgi:hypothetical protein
MHHSDACGVCQDPPAGFCGGTLTAWIIFIAGTIFTLACSVFATRTFTCAVFTGAIFCTATRCLVHNLYHLLYNIVSFSFFHRIGNAGFQVVCHKKLVSPFESRLDSLRLMDTVDAIAAVFHHRNDFRQMPKGNLIPAEDCVLGRLVSGNSFRHSSTSSLQVFYPPIGDKDIISKDFVLSRLYSARDFNDVDVFCEYFSFENLYSLEANRDDGQDNT